MSNETLIEQARHFAKYSCREQIPLDDDIVYGKAPEREWMARKLATFAEQHAQKQISERLSAVADELQRVETLLREGMESTGPSAFHYHRMSEAIAIIARLRNTDHAETEEPKPEKTIREKLLELNEQCHEIYKQTDNQHALDLIALTEEYLLNLDRQSEPSKGGACCPHPKHVGKCTGKLRARRSGRDINCNCTGYREGV